MRLDQLVAERFGLTRTRAQNLIKTGGVSLFGAVAGKPSTEVAADAEITIRDTLKYASLGGLKLENALRTFHLDVSGWSALDLGAANGGFTDCLLQAGVAEVVAVDLRIAFPESLAKDSRVTMLDGVNIKNIDTLLQDRLFDLIVVDLSFISLCGLFPMMASFLRENGVLIALFKPQFEVGKKALPKSGVVRDVKVIEKAFTSFCAAATCAGLSYAGDCPVPAVFPDKNPERTVCFRLK